MLASMADPRKARGVRHGAFGLVMAVIGGSENIASIGLHSALGFTHAGLVQGAGWKQERWLDLVLMQRTLGLGASQPPAAA